MFKVIILGILLINIQLVIATSDPDYTKIGVLDGEVYTFRIEKYDSSSSSGGFLNDGTIIAVDNETGNYIFVNVGGKFEITILNSTVVTKNGILQVAFSANDKSIIKFLNLTESIDLRSFIVLKDWEYMREWKENFYHENLQNLGYLLTITDTDKEFGFQYTYNKELDEVEKKYTTGAERTESIDRWIFDKNTGVLIEMYYKYDIIYEDGSIEQIERHIIAIEPNNEENSSVRINIGIMVVMLTISAMSIVKKKRMYS